MAKDRPVFDFRRGIPPGKEGLLESCFSARDSPIQKELAGNVQDPFGNCLGCLHDGGNCPAFTLMRSRSDYLKGKNSEKNFCASQHTGFIKPLLKVIIGL